MSNSGDPFLQLSDSAGDPVAMIETLVKTYRREQMPHELFEALKMQIRVRLGLPILGQEEGQPRPEEIERQLEKALLDACREVGTMLIRRGRIREGWMYFRPTGDTAAAAHLLRQVSGNDENLDDLIQVALHEGVDIELGYGLLLEHRGTCNSITAFDQAVAHRHYREQRLAAGLLLDHVYRELQASIVADLQRRSPSNAPIGSVEELLKQYPELLSGGAYHIDTTHLASTVRIGRVLEQPEQIAKLCELVEYGRRLHPQYQYAGEEPFLDFYPAHALFFGAIRGRGVPQAVSYFQRKATEIDPIENGTGAIEVYVDLLDRLGRAQEALEAAVQMIPADIPAQRVAPLLIELAEKAHHKQPVLDFARRRGDLLLFAAALSLPS